MTLFFIVEMIGTIAFACSGAMLAIRKQLDLLGVIVLGVVTAVGGGMFRDLLIGVMPPTMFIDPVYTAAATIAVLVLFLAVRCMHSTVDILSSEKYDKLLNLMDAVGLGAFTVVGIDTAVSAGYGDRQFLTIFLGVLTGVGGGLLRDIMAGETPAILKRHIYACASLAGAECYYQLMGRINNNAAILISTILVVVIRVLARKYHWNLPRAM